jgi:hypothetical protein
MRVFHCRRRRHRKTFRRSLTRFRRFHGSIAPRRIGYQRMKKMFGGVSNIVDGAIKRFFVRFRWLRKTAELANELKRRRANLILSRWRKEVMKGLDVSAHGFSPLILVVEIAG